jgi:hypothetical protein
MTGTRPYLYLALAGLTLALARPAAAAGVTLGFDDVPNDLSKRVPVQDPGPAGVAGVYAGFVWSGWQVQDYGYYNGLYRNALAAAGPFDPPPAQGHDGPRRPGHLINLAPGATSGTPVATVATSGVPFRLQEVHLTGFRVGSESGTGLVNATAREVTIEGYRAGQRVGASGPVDLSLATGFVSWRPDWADPIVDELRFTPDFYVPNPLRPDEVVYRSFLVDSLSVQSVPLPAAAALLAAPLLGLAGLARRPGPGRGRRGPG